MSYTGYTPSRSPLITDQFAPADYRFPRLDGANVPGGLFKNGFINGSFDHWQRGAGPVSAVGIAYGADRWATNVSAETVLAYTRQTLGIGDIPSDSKYFARVNVSGQNTAGSYAIFQQRKEGVQNYAGKRIVIRGMARRVAGAGDVVAEIVQSFGSGGSANVNTYGGRIALGANWAPFAIAVNVPQINGKIIGTSGDALFVSFWLSGGSDFNSRLNNLGLQSLTVDFADLEMREVIPGYGDQLGPYERVPADIELLRCQRFYQIVNAVLYRYSTGNFNFQGGIVSFRFPVEMRAGPTGVITNLSGQLYNGGSPRAIVAGDLTISVGDGRGGALLFAATGTAGDYANAIMAFNAEL